MPMIQSDLMNVAVVSQFNAQIAFNFKKRHQTVVHTCDEPCCVNIFAGQPVRKLAGSNRYQTI